MTTSPILRTSVTGQRPLGHEHAHFGWPLIRRRHVPDIMVVDHPVHAAPLIQDVPEIILTYDRFEAAAGGGESPQEITGSDHLSRALGAGVPPGKADHLSWRHQAA